MNLSLEVITTGAKTFGLELTDPAALLPQRNKKPLPAKKPAARN
jgi:hypothetical protein